MPSLNEILNKHRICALEKEIRKRFVLNRLSDWVDPASFSDWHFSVYRFATKRPFIYFNVPALTTALQFYIDHSNEIFRVLTDLDHRITHAIMSMVRQGSSWNHESPLSLRDPRDIARFEQIWHPEYQRYCEHVFNHLIRIPLGILGILRGRDYQSPALANRVETLRNSGLRELTSGYDATVRNAISHGSTAFRVQTIVYQGEQTSSELSAREFAGLFDSLVDSCHAMVLALLIFLCGNRNEAIPHGIGRLPLGLRYLLVDGVASHRAFNIVSMIDSKVIRNRKQLNIYCSTRTSSRMVHLFESLSVGWNCQRMGGQNYDRFAVSIDCGKPVPASIFLNAQELLRVSRHNLPPKQATAVIETNLLWHDAPNWARRLYVWKNIFLQAFTLAKFQIHDQLLKSGFPVLSSRYLIRRIENKSAAEIRRLEAQIVLTAVELPSRRILLDIVRHATRKLRRKRIPKVETTRVGKIKRKPSYVWIKLHRRDGRIRTLLSSTWASQNLLLQAEWMSVRYRRRPIFVKSADEALRGIHIQFNPNMLSQIDSNA